MVADGKQQVVCSALQGGLLPLMHPYQHPIPHHAQRLHDGGGLHVWLGCIMGDGLHGGWVVAERMAESMHGLLFEGIRWAALWHATGDVQHGGMRVIYCMLVCEKM